MPDGYVHFVQIIFLCLLTFYIYTMPAATYARANEEAVKEAHTSPINRTNYATNRTNSEYTLLVLFIYNHFVPSAKGLISL